MLSAQSVTSHQEAVRKKRNKAMADFLTETQIGEIQNAYNAIDTDADGIIATSDLGSLLRLLGQNPTDAELQVRNLIHLSAFLTE